MTYAIEFRYPEGTLYAGLHKGALGWASTLKTALLFESEDAAIRTVQNGYGAQRQWAFVVPVTTVGALNTRRPQL